MKNLFKKVIISTIIAAVAISIPIEIIALFKNEATLKSEAETKLEYAVDSYAKELNMIFNSMNDLVNMMQAIASSSFSGEIYRTDYEQYLRSKKEMGDILKKTLNETVHLTGLYLTFNPEIYKNRQEIWYAYDSDGSVQYIDSSPVTPVWLPDDSETERDYYYDAVKDGDYWEGCDRDKTLNVDMTTHTKPAYDINGELIGIVGADILMDDITEIIESMHIYDKSQVVLFGPDLKYYAGNLKTENPDEYFETLASEILKKSAKQGYFWYDSPDGELHVAAYTTLDNGFIFSSSQPKHSIMTAAVDTRRTLIFTTACTIILLIIIVAFLIRRNYNPVINRAENNEIILIHQSRQAKLGEMVGNISHQCKQPINSINISLSNLQDDFNAHELSKEDLDAYIGKIRGYTRSMSETMSDFANFLKPAKEKERLNIADGIDLAVDMLASGLKTGNIEIKNNADPELYITTYKNEFIQCLVNITENARDAVISCEDTKDRIIEFNTETIGHKTKITIFNTGKHIADDLMKKIFEPYYSTKESSGGSGLGLYLTKKIVEEHMNGKLYCENISRGVVFTIELEDNNDENMG